MAEEVGIQFSHLVCENSHVPGPFKIFLCRHLLYFRSKTRFFENRFLDFSSRTHRIWAKRLRTLIYMHRASLLLHSIGRGKFTWQILRAGRLKLVCFLSLELPFRTNDDNRRNGMTTPIKASNDDLYQTKTLAGCLPWTHRGRLAPMCTQRPLMWPRWWNVHGDLVDELIWKKSGE